MKPAFNLFRHEPISTPVIVGKSAIMQALHMRGLTTWKKWKRSGFPVYYTCQGQAVVLLAEVLAYLKAVDGIRSARAQALQDAAWDRVRRLTPDQEEPAQLRQASPAGHDLVPCATLSLGQDSSSPGGKANLAGDTCRDAAALRRSAGLHLALRSPSVKVCAGPPGR